MSIARKLNNRLSTPLGRQNPKPQQQKNSPGRSNPFELHVSLQEVTLRMLLQLREMIPAAAAGGAAPRGGEAASQQLAVGASAICGISVGNYRRLPGERGEDEVDDTTVDAEVVDAGDGDVDDSWRGALKNAGPLESMVRGLLAAPAAEGAARGPSPGERRRRRVQAVLCAGLLGAVAFAAVLGGGAVGRGGKRSDSEGGKRKESRKAEK